MNLFPDLSEKPKRPKPPLRWPADVRVTCSPASADYRETLAVSTDDDSEGPYIAPRALIAVLANPSTADESSPDPTLSTLWTRAHAKGLSGPDGTLWHADRMVILNLYPMRSTNPRDARDAIAQGDALPCPPVEVLLAKALDELHGAPFRLLFGWGDCLGEHADKLSAPVLSLCRERQIQAYALDFTAKGRPGHPLYKSYSLPLLPVEMNL